MAPSRPASDRHAVPPREGLTPGTARAPRSATTAGASGPVAPFRPRLRDVVPLWVLVAAALAALVVAGLLGGIFTERLTGFRDGGALARIGLPIARTIHDAFAATTVGLLLLAGTMIPESRTTNRRGTATRLATRTGAVWTAAGLVTLLLQIANISGVEVADPGFAAQVVSVVWAFDVFRVAFISLVIALGVTIGSSLVRTRTGITWMAALSLVALLPLALAGHAGGAAAHDTAVNSLAVHLAAASVWVGGLAGILILRPVLGSALTVTVQRYSVLAAWCFAGVAVSGVLNGSLRLGGLADLATEYGAVLVVKVLIVGLLGVAGWRMRSAIIAKLASDAPARHLFGLLALTEVALMGVAVGLGVGLSRSEPPVSQDSSSDIATSLTGYPAPSGPLEGMAWFTTVRIDWLWLTVALLGIGLYVGGVARLHRRGDSWPWTRTVPWVLGWLVFVWATSGAPGVYGRLQFSVHMLMHMTLSMAIPFCLSLGAPLTLASRALRARRDKTLGPREILLATAHSRYLGFFANPIIAAVNFFGSLIVFYFTGLFELALRTHTGHIAMVIHFMLAGYVFCWILIGEDPGPKRWAPSLRLVLLFMTMSFHAFFGVALLSGTTLLGADFFRALQLPWLPGDAGLLADQVNGGAITWGIGEAPMLLLALMVGVVWMRSDEHEAKRNDRQADRDHDAELTAYNEVLARRARAYEESERAERRP